MADTDSQFITPAELCERLRNKVRPSTLRNWRSQGKGPKYRRIGRNVMYHIEDVKDWENKNRE